MRKKEYRESIRKMKFNILWEGEKLDNLIDHPRFQTIVELFERGYELPFNPEYDDLMFYSSLVDKEVPLGASLFTTKQDFRKFMGAIKKISCKYLCTNCMPAIVNCLWAITWEIDQEKNTNYHDNLRRVVTHLQEGDLRFTIGIMDARGDRKLKPSEQVDPDLYVRVVEKNDKGIIVRGAKAYHSDAPLSHYMLIMPCRVMGPEDKDYAVSFVIPTDTEGITYICSTPRAPKENFEYERPLSRLTDYVECITVFDDVFVPWEKVLMCGEWEFTPTFMNYFAAFARFVKCTCTTARIDFLAGVTSLLAKANGIDNTSHVREKILEMITYSQMGYGCSKGALDQVFEHPSGVAIPGFGETSAGLYLMRQVFPRFLGHIADIGGGLVLTVPSEKTYADSEAGALIEKYLKGKAEVLTTDRLKLMYLARDIVGSDLTGYYFCSVLDAAGGIEPNKVDVRRSYNLSEKEAIVKELTGLKSL